MLAYLDTIIAFAVIMLGFSLLITLLNQMISAFLGYRGSNLRWGVETMLTTLDPNLAARARDIANHVLTDPIVSDSVFAKFTANVPVFGKLIQRWKLASAISPDTLIRTLTKVSRDMRANPAFPATIPTAIEGLLGQIDPETARKLKMIYDAFEPPAAVPPATAADPVNYAVQVDDLLKQLGNSVQQSVGKIEAWFNIAMNRVSQRFSMQIRIWTIVFAFLLAFGIQLDSFSLFNQLLGNPALRERVMNQSGAMLAEAEAILGTQTGGQAGGTSEPTTAPQVLADKMKFLIETDVKKETEAKPELLGAIPSFKTLAEAETWLRNGLKPEVPVKRADDLATKYRGYVIAGLREKAKDVTDILQKTGLELVPGNRKLADLKHPVTFFFNDFKGGVKNFLGVLLTAGLLALGAPFWFNALKTLTNLRPMVATRQDQQKKDAA